ncbi:YopX family protein [Clostridium perfringens]|nr:YopX family protein [Clostridium perfringens]
MGRDIKFRGWDSVNEVMLQVESINDWKVIGNIYENPEMLEG